MRGEPGEAGGEFRTTHWSCVLQAGREGEPRAEEALDQLCQVYWRPIYAFVRRRGYPAHEAEDLVQSFFLGLLRRKGLQRADPAQGRFRAFLLTSLNHHLANEWAKGQRLKRGGGALPISIDAQAEEERYLAEPADEASPERLFERRWAEIVLERVTQRVRADLVAAGQEQRFEVLRGFLLGDAPGLSYDEAGRRLGLSIAAVTSAIHRLRSRYREFFLDEIARTVAEPAEVDDEIRYLARALAS
ncbi:MAG: sigma-70 family RNA polymerase sigma factor [Verrucomicrobiae bacterium]|nr:sigma-70 family RNA polymerase sigma factor [Verrucomicrobiae bacterium]